MEFLGLPSGGAIALNFPMKSVFSGFDDRYGLCNTKLFGKVGLSFNVCIDTATISERAIGPYSGSEISTQRHFIG
jgi:hypothetical protein